MAKHTVEGALYVYATKYSIPGKPQYHFNAGPDITSESFVKVVNHSFDVEIPDDFDPVPGQISALTEQKRQLRLKLAEELAEIDDRISKLSALTFEAVT